MYEHGIGRGLFQRLQPRINRKLPCLAAKYRRCTFRFHAASRCREVVNVVGMNDGNDLADRRVIAERAERAAEQGLAAHQPVLLGLSRAGSMAPASCNDDGCNSHVESQTRVTSIGYPSN